MSCIRNTIVCGFLACLAFWPATARAQPNASFSIPIHGVLRDGATSINISNIILNAAGTSGFSFNFVLPRDYLNNSEVWIVLTFNINSGGCSVRFEPDVMARYRTGRAHVVSLAGLTAPNPVINIVSTDVLPKNF